MEVKITTNDNEVISFDSFHKFLENVDSFVPVTLRDVCGDDSGGSFGRVNACSDNHAADDFDSPSGVTKFVSWPKDRRSVFAVFVGRGVRDAIVWVDLADKGGVLVCEAGFLPKDNAKLVCSVNDAADPSVP